MEDERGCTMADLLDPGLHLGGELLQLGFATGRIQWITPRPPARPDGATRRVVWMNPRPPGRP